MYGFVELSGDDGKRLAVSIDSIRMISERRLGGCVIRFKSLSGTTFADGQERFPTGMCFVRESYDEIKRKIMEAGRCD